METSKRNYLPVVVVIVVLNALFIGGALLYLNRQNTTNARSVTLVPTEQASPTEQVATPESSLDLEAKQKAEEIAALMEWEVVSIGDEEVVLKGGPSGEDEMRIKLDANFAVENGELADLRVGQKVRIGSTPTGKVTVSISGQ